MTHRRDSLLPICRLSPRRPERAERSRRQPRREPVRRNRLQETASRSARARHPWRRKNKDWLAVTQNQLTGQAHALLSTPTGQLALPPSLLTRGARTNCKRMSSRIGAGESMKRVIWLLCVCLLFAGCSSQDADKTREEAAKAAAKLKQETKEAVKDLKKGAEEARTQGEAVAEGVREGLKSDEGAVNINRASREQLLDLPGMNESSADAIIAGRPYHTKAELANKGGVSPEEYRKIEGLIVVK